MKQTRMPLVLRRSLSSRLNGRRTRRWWTCLGVLTCPFEVDARVESAEVRAAFSEWCFQRSDVTRIEGGGRLACK